MVSAITAPIVLMSPLLKIEILPADIERLKEAIVSHSQHPNTVLRARILLKTADYHCQGIEPSIAVLAREFGTHRGHVVAALRGFQKGGVDAALDHAGTSKMRKALTPEMLQRLSQLREQAPPDHALQGRWTLQLLAEELTSQGFQCSVTSVSQAINHIEKCR